MLILTCEFSIRSTVGAGEALLTGIERGWAMVRRGANAWTDVAASIASATMAEAALETWFIGRGWAVGSRR